MNNNCEFSFMFAKQMIWLLWLLTYPFNLYISILKRIFHFSLILSWCNWRMALSVSTCFRNKNVFRIGYYANIHTLNSWGNFNVRLIGTIIITVMWYCIYYSRIIKFIDIIPHFYFYDFFLITYLSNIESQHLKHIHQFNMNR